MRKLKKLSAILLTGVLTFSAVACGNSTGNHAKTESGTSVQERIASVQTKMQEVKSLEMSMDMDMALKATEDGESFDFTMKTSGVTSMLQDPMKAKSDMTVDMGELGSQTVQSYIEEVDGKYMVYSGIDNAWTSTELSADLIAQYDAKQSANAYLKGFSNAKEVGTEEVNGKQTTKIEGEVSGEALEDMVNETGLLQSLTGTVGSDADMLKNMLSDMGGLKITLWVTDDNELVKVEEDMTDMMSKMMEKLSGENGADIAMEVSTAKLSVTYDKINAVDDFEIPEEAKNATPVN